MLYKWERKRPKKYVCANPLMENGTNGTGMRPANVGHGNLPKVFGFAPSKQDWDLSKNCTHWMFSDLAIMMAGHVSVPLYPNSADSLKQILIHSETKVLFVGKLDDFEKMRPGIPKE